MKGLYSGLDAWRQITESDPQRDSIETYLPLVLSAVGAFGVFPFMILRYMQGSWIPAIVDTVIVIGFAALGIYVFRTRRVRFASIAISLFCVIGLLTSVYVLGPQQIYWIYPATMAVFYLLRPREAVALIAFTVCALLPAVVGIVDSQAATTIFVTIAMMSSFAFAFSLIANRQRDQLLRLATKDPLTGAGNRRHFDSKLSELVDSMQRKKTPACLIVVDLDHFKEVNDIYGHATGDQILRQVTEIMNLRIRSTDSLYRIGGEEFVVVLEGQDVEHGERLAEQLRTLIEANELIPERSVTVSLGVAELSSEESWEDWLQRADKAMYAAKRSGRNTTCIAA